jgi:hypothetical protein
MNYWPWWLGAIALASITVGFPLWTGRTFGMSGLTDRVLAWRDEREVERMDAETDVAALQAALSQGTAEAVGGAGTTTDVLTRPETSSGAVAEPPPTPPESTRPLPVAFAAVMLVSTFVGGLIAALANGRFELRPDLGPAFSEVVTDNPVVMVVVLFVAGLLIGFGTRMAGGCTSGHGLTGCSRLHPVSLLATATFFGTAVIVSFLLWKVI